MIPKNLDPLPTINEEIDAYAAKINTLNLLERLATSNTKILRQALLECPLGPDTIDIQHIINASSLANIDLQKTVQFFKNKTVEEHHKAVEILMHNENLLEEEKEPETISEDEFAAIKSNLLGELHASTAVRSQDAIMENAFELKLEKLTKDFLSNHTGVF